MQLYLLLELVRILFQHEKIEFLGLKVDYLKNMQKVSEPTFLTKKSSKIKALVIPTNEELMIARSTYKIACDKSNE